jgi:hypothetical protein
MHKYATIEKYGNGAAGRVFLRRTFFVLASLVVLSCLFSTPCLAIDEAENLRQKFTVLKPYLENNQFQRLLYLNSVELDYSIRGDIYAVLDYPFADASKVLNDPEKGPVSLCQIMMLHPNTKYCRAMNGKNGKILSTKIGKKYEQPLEDAYDMEFSYKNGGPPGTGYIRIELKCDSGPFSTKDYVIMIRMVSLDENRSFLHLSYSLGYGFAARTAIKVYLATIASDKVGFTRLDNPPGPEPRYIRGMRGVVERNTMRYYLAIEAFLNATHLPPDKQLNRRLTRWFDTSEKYARQLHELDRQEYLQMKYEEHRRLQAPKEQPVVSKDDAKR